jgi:hypothetical protein
MLDKSGIMKAAWKSYNRDHAWRGAFNRVLFSRCLGIAWAYAKASVKPVSPIDAIKQEIHLLSYKSSRINTVPMQRALEAQLASIGA